MLKTVGLSVVIVLALVTRTTFCLASEEPNAADQDKAVRMNKLLGRGVNLGNALDGPTEGAWGVTLKEEYFQLIKDAGFNSIRLPVRWSAHALKKTPYTIDQSFLKRVDWAVNCALSRDLPIIVNVHHYNELNADPAGHKQRFLALWKQLAEHYKDYPDQLLFEPLNEPHGELNEQQWNQLIKEVLAVIRESNPDRTVIFGPANLNAIPQIKSLELPEDDRNIIVTVHHYFPMEFTHQGATWITDGDSKAWLGTTWTGTDEEKKAMTDIFDIGASWAKVHNRPMNLGEFGAYKKADMDSRARWTKFIADTAVQRGMSLHYWEFCAPEFGLYEQRGKFFHEFLLKAVLADK